MKLFFCDPADRSKSRARVFQFFCDICLNFLQISCASGDRCSTFMSNSDVFLHVLQCEPAFFLTDLASLCQLFHQA